MSRLSVICGGVTQFYGFISTTGRRSVDGILKPSSDNISCYYLSDSTTHAQNLKCLFCPFSAHSNPFNASESLRRLNPLPVAESTISSMLLPHQLHRYESISELNKYVLSFPFFQRRKGSSDDSNNWQLPCQKYCCRLIPFRGREG